MLAIVLYCAAAGGVSWLAGALLIELCGAVRPTRPADHALAAAWLGLAALAALLLVIAFVVPLTAGVGAVVAVAVTLVALANRGVRRATRQTIAALGARHVLVAATLAAGVALFASVAPTFYDTAMYQYAESQWLAAFGVVRGLALFQNRLGTISPWYALVAPFEQGALRARMIHAPMALALWLALLAVATGAIRWVRGDDRPADRFLMLAVGAWVLSLLAFPHPGVVPSPDLAWSVLMLLGVWAWLLERDAPGDALAPHARGMLPLLLAAAAAGVRFNALPAAGCAWLFYVAAGPRPLRRAVAGAAIAAALVLPELAATFRTSGCPLFPTALLCVDRPWALGAQHAREYGAFVRWFARANEGRMDVLPPTPDASGWRWWLPAWVRHHALVIALALATPALALLPVSRREPWWRALRWLAIAGTACVAVTFVVAPANRFLVPYVLAVPCAAIALATWPARRPAFARRAWVGLGVAAALLLVLVARSGFHPRALLSHPAEFSERQLSGDLLLPQPMRAPDSLQVAHAGALTYYTPAPPPSTYRPISLYNPMDARCWRAPFPCTSQLAAPGVTLASPREGLGAGFVKGSPGGAPPR